MAVYLRLRTPKWNRRFTYQSILDLHGGYGMKITGKPTQIRNDSI
jgi:hypothetical protein